MSDKVFLDTNIWVYAAAGRLSAPEKCAVAGELIADFDLGVSPQVIGEFIVNVQSAKKMKLPLDNDETQEWVDRMLLFPLVEADRETVIQALLIARRYKIRYWDAAVVASAARFGASILYTEDLNHGQLYGVVRAVNPFRPH